MDGRPPSSEVDRTPLIGRLAIPYFLKDCTVLHLPFRELPESDPGTPDTRSPLRYLLWNARRQKLLLTLNAIFGIGWMTAQALTWAAVGAAIDDGVARHSVRGLVTWVLVVLGLGVFQAICGALRHQLAVTNWMNAAYRSVQLIGRHVSRVGTAVTDEIPAGDVVNTVMADVMRIGGAYDVFARFMGAIVSWLVVSVILLSSSFRLGLIVLIGVPVLASLTTPLMKPLHTTQAAQRDVAGRLAAMAADTVAGLRILRGVGGEDVFLANYQAQSQRVRRAGVRIAGPQAALESGQVLLPAILTTVVTWLGARDVMSGALQPGQLVAFFGYASFLTTPLRTAIEYVISTTRAYVGAGRVLRILTISPTIPEPASPATWPDEVTTLHDPVSSLTLRAHQVTGLVSATPEEAVALVDRLGRFVPTGNDVLVNDRPLAEFSLADTRAHIVVSEIEPRLFAGVLRAELVPHGHAEDAEILSALRAASALDILDGLDDGLSSAVEERGRGFSGGQRQRLALARALLSDAEVLLLVEPTSAVDTHTERRIAQGLGEVRRDQLTMICTSSPLLLEHMDRVVLLDGDQVVAEGSHEELLETSSLYRQIVLREDAA